MLKIRLGAAAATVALAAATGVATAAGGSTQTHIYNPFTSSGKPAVHVSHAFSGGCFAGSIPAPRKGAWRCASGAAISDPCFSWPKAKGYVLCASNGPWGEIIRLNLVTPLNLSKGNKKPASTTYAWPWALKTTSGLRCTFNYNMQAKVNHRFETYLCNHNKGLWGKISRATAQWTIYSAAHGATRAHIAAAWF